MIYFLARQNKEIFISWVMLSSIGGKIHDNVQQTNSEDTLRKLGLRRDVLLLHAINSYNT